MRPHDAFLQLAATGIDFPLAPAERGRLEQHLAACPTCARTVAALRADTLVLSSLPSVMLPERRGADILAAALHPSVVRFPLRLVLVAALLGLLLIGSLAVGSELVRRMDDGDLSVVLPVPTARAMPAPSGPEPSGPPPSTLPSADPAARSGRLGDAWTRATVQVAADRPAGQVEAVTAGGPGFVAVGRGCMGDTPICEAIVWTSTDGKDWQRAPASAALDTGAYLPTSGPEIGMFDVTAGGPGIVAVGYAARPDMAATVWFSPDATTWERFTLGDVSSTRVHAVTWDGRSFVAVGEDRDKVANAKGLASAKARAAAWTSSDGRTWTRVPHTTALDVGGFIDTTEDPSTGGMNDVMASPNGLVAVGSVCSNDPVGCVPAAWTSEDGTTWERAAGMPAVSGVLRAVAGSGTRFTAVGAETCGSSPVAIPQPCPALVLTSPNGQLWTQQPFEQGGDLRTLADVGGRYFATAPDGPATVWTSDLGSAWAPAVLEGGPSTTTGGGQIAAFHFAATQDVAVWLGTAPGSTDLVAWVSTVEAAP